MATTAYTILVNGEALEGTKSKKAQAIEIAQAQRDELRADVRVVTQAGTVVFEQAAPKTIKMSPKYTRVVELPEGVVVPKGKRVAYSKARKGLAVLHDANAPEGEAYSILDFAKGEGDERFATTREAGRFTVNA